MAKEIKFSLLYRDMWQSSGKYVPTVEQLTEVAPAIIEMGCFARVETNGGGFEQINLLLGDSMSVVKALVERQLLHVQRFTRAIEFLPYGVNDLLAFLELQLQVHD